MNRLALLVQHIHEPTEPNRMAVFRFGRSGACVGGTPLLVSRREERVNGSRRRVLVAAMVVVGLSLGGCLTLDPTITANTGDSAVFESVSVNESWATGRVRASATLSSSPKAGNVTQITVVTASGKSFSTVNLDPGQTNVVLSLPANRNATLVASDTINGTTIEKLNITTGGNKIA